MLQLRGQRNSPFFSSILFSSVVQHITVQYVKLHLTWHPPSFDPHIFNFLPNNTLSAGCAVRKLKLQAKMPWVIELMPNITQAANHLCNVNMHCEKLGKKFCNENTQIYVSAEIMPWLKNRWLKYVLHGIGSFSAAPGWKIFESSIKGCLQGIIKHRYKVPKWQYTVRKG